MTTKQCQCGCGAEVKRSFLPGHDAKHKSNLLAALRSTNRAQVEKAAYEMVERGWGHMAPVEVLATVPDRGWFRGYSASVRMDDVRTNGTRLDEAGMHHAFANCQKAKGRTVKVEAGGLDEWRVCSHCTHSQNLDETAWKQRLAFWTAVEK